MDEGIELGLDLGDAVEMRGDEFERRNFPAAKFFQGFRDGGINGLGHGLRKQVNGAIGIGQGELEEVGGKPL